MIRVALKIFAFLILLVAIVVPSVYAYGGGGGGRTSPSCVPPSFADESPGKDAAISSFSGFSFIASPNTNQSTIVVKINGEVVDVKVTKKRYGGLLVEGNLPKAITEGGFVTISISADSTSQCNRSYVYRVKISDAADIVQHPKT